MSDITTTSTVNKEQQQRAIDGITATNAFRALNLDQKMSLVEGLKPTDIISINKVLTGEYKFFTLEEFVHHRQQSFVPSKELANDRMCIADINCN